MVRLFAFILKALGDALVDLQQRQWSDRGEAIVGADRLLRGDGIGPGWGTRERERRCLKDKINRTCGRSRKEQVVDRSHTWVPLPRVHVRMRPSLHRGTPSSWVSCPEKGLVSRLASPDQMRTDFCSAHTPFCIPRIK